MSRINNSLELYKLLPKSNCQRCRRATCLAFAVAVMKGEISLGECSVLDQGIIEKLDVRIERQSTNTDEQKLEKYMDDFKRSAAEIEFPSAAEKLGATSCADGMTIKCLGKSYILDSAGNVTSECHMNSFVIIPLLNYVMASPGKDPSGPWVSFRELGNGDTWNHLFEQRCVRRLKQIADDDFELFEYILCVFGGKPSTSSRVAETSFTLYPLPKVPLRISYSSTGEDMESRLSVLFDATAEDNLNIESIYGLATGIATMLEKIAARHS